MRTSIGCFLRRETRKLVDCEVCRRSSFVKLGVSHLDRWLRLCEAEGLVYPAKCPKCGGDAVLRVQQKDLRLFAVHPVC